MLHFQHIIVIVFQKVMARWLCFYTIIVMKFSQSINRLAISDDILVFCHITAFSIESAIIHQ